MIRLSLPWPPKALSPNARPHWGEKSKATSSAKELAHVSAIVAGVKRANLKAPIALTYTFHPPTARRMDDDNAIARCKAYRDGLASALGIDDRNFRTREVQWGDPIKGGVVAITLEAAT